MISEKISHGAFSQTYIVKKELEMLRTLEFDIDRVTSYDFLTNLLRISRLQFQIDNKVYSELKELSGLILLMCIQNQ